MLLCLKNKDNELGGACSQSNTSGEKSNALSSFGKFSKSSRKYNENDQSLKSSKRKLFQIDRRNAVSSLDVSKSVCSKKSSSSLMSTSVVRISSDTNNNLFKSTDDNDTLIHQSFDESIDSSSSIPSVELSINADDSIRTDLIQSTLPKTPVIIKKNQLTKQDDPFLRDLTACIQLKQQQKKNNETNNNSEKLQISDESNKSPLKNNFNIGQSNLNINSPVKKLSDETYVNGNLHKVKLN